VRAAAPDPEPVPATPAKLEPDDEDDDDDEDEDEDDSEPAKARAKPSREIEGTRARVKPVERDRANRVARPAAQQKPGKQEAQSKGGMLWVALIAAALLGAWWLLHEPKKEEAAQLDTVAQPEEPELENAPVAPPPEPVAAPAAVEPAEPAELAEPSPAAEPVAAEQKPAPGDPSPQAAPAAAQPAAQPAAGDGTFDRIVALKALGKSAEKASRCRMRGEAPDTAEVLVTFEPSGRVRDARIASGAYVGTLTGKCILERLSETTIAPFSGSARTVTTSVGVR
jgi:hypothetical protein